MSFDATDLEIARRQHDYEMGIEDTSDASWNRFFRAASKEVIARGWDELFTGGARAGQSRGLDGADDETGYSIDSAYEAWERGLTVAAYMGKVKAARESMGL